MVSGRLCKLGLMSPFGERLLQGMQAAKMDRKALATALGISPQAVGQAIKEGKFSAANTAKAARLLCVNWYWLATGDETMALNAGAALTDQERAVLARLVDSDAASRVRPGAPPATTVSNVQTLVPKADTGPRGGLRLTAEQSNRRSKESAVEIERRQHGRRSTDENK